MVSLTHDQHRLHRLCRRSVLLLAINCITACSSPPPSARVDKAPVRIDTVGIRYSSYLGGSGSDWVAAIAVGPTGNLYLTGATSSTDFPTTPDALQRSNGGGLDVFISILDPAGSSLLYSTYFGGSRDEIAYSIAVDSCGIIYVTGSTGSLDFPTSPDAFQTQFGGGSLDGFVLKLDPTEGQLLYSTFLGGSGNDYGLGIATDGCGSTLITGLTDSDNFPTSPGAFQQNHQGDSSDAFVTKLGPGGSEILYSTYFGGSGDDYGTGVTVDAQGRAIFVGSTRSSDFPTSQDAIQPTIGGAEDAFIAKMDDTGSALLYSSFLGGNGIDHATGVALDAVGNAYVTGHTESQNFPVTPGAFQTVEDINALPDAFVTAMSFSDAALIYSTFLGGSRVDRAYAVAVDSSGQALVTGLTVSLDFPVTRDAFQAALRGDSDVFVSQLDSAGHSLIYSTYLGGVNTDQGLAGAFNASGALYVAGQTNSRDFPITPGAFQTTYHFANDGFAVAFDVSGNRIPHN